MHLSIVVPLAPNEKLEPKLSADIAALAEQPLLKSKTELLVVSSCEKTLEQAQQQLNQLSVCLKSVVASSGRASCMNKGANEAAGKWLLFLHADSHFEQGFYKPLESLVQTSGSGIYYYNLKFSDGSPLMRLNEWGVRFRCFFLKTPFGDQGLVMTKETFVALGAYDLNAPYGEDHLLVRKARGQKRPVESLGKVIFTNARKYSRNGWLKTTVLHQRLWYAQIIEDRRKE